MTGGEARAGVGSEPNVSSRVMLMPFPSKGDQCIDVQKMHWSFVVKRVFDIFGRDRLSRAMNENAVFEVGRT